MVIVDFECNKEHFQLFRSSRPFKKILWPSCKQRKLDKPFMIKSVLVFHQTLYFCDRLLQPTTCETVKHRYRFFPKQ